MFRPATIAVTKLLSMDRLVAAAPVGSCNRKSSLSSGIATAVIGGCGSGGGGAVLSAGHLANVVAQDRRPVPRQKARGADGSWRGLGHDALEHVADPSLGIESH